MSVAQIARVLGVARQGVQRLADVLEGEGLIAYADNPQHQRAKLVRLTAEGAARLGAIEIAQAGWADGLGAAFTSAELDAARAVMARVMEMLEAGEASPRPLRRICSTPPKTKKGRANPTFPSISTNRASTSVVTIRR